MNTDVLTLAPGGQPLAQSLGYDAASVIVDNLTSSYLSLPDAGKTLPPWVYGAVVSLPPGLSRATAKLVPTVPAIAGPPVPVSQATLTWTDQVLPPDPGHLLQAAQFGVQSVIATIAGGAGATVGPTNVAVPAGAQAVGYIVRSDAGRDTPVSVTIIGHQTVNDYASGTVLDNKGGAKWFPFSASDSSVDVTLVCNGVSPSAIDVLATPTIPVVDIVQTFGSTIKVVLADSGANALYGIGGPVPVANVTANPALWQTFPLSKRIDITASGADQAVGIGDGTHTLYLGPSMLFSGAAARFAFKDGNAGTTKWVQPTLANTPTPIGWNGLKLTAANDLFVNGPNGDEIEFSVSYNLG